MSQNRSARPAGPGGHGGGPGGRGRMAPGQKAKDFKGSIRRLLQYLRPSMLPLALVVVLAVLSVVFQIVGPKIMSGATNKLFEGVISRQLPAGVPIAQAITGLRAAGQTQLADMLSGMPNVIPGAGIDYAGIGSILLRVGALYLTGFLFSWLTQYVMAGVSQRTVRSLRTDVDHKLARLPLAAYDRSTRGEILSRVTNDIDNISNSLTQSITQLISGALTIAGVLVMMLTISIPLAVISLLVIPASLFTAFTITRFSQKHYVKQWAAVGALSGHIEEMYTGHAIVTAFGRTGAAIEEFDKRNKTHFDSSFMAQFLSGVMWPAMNVISNLNYVVVAVFGGLRVAQGQMTLGDVQAFIQYSRQFTQPIVQTSSIMNVLQSTVASAERVFELLDEKEMDADGTEVLQRSAIRGEVVFDKVAFRYTPEKPLIEDFNLRVTPGQTVAIVGPTGAGKTTLVNLIMRFYELNGGTITIDGKDIRSCTRESVRGAVGMVLQDSWLFDGTIRDNIAYGRAGATEEEIVAASKMAYVDHFTRTLPDGYATVLNDNGSNISQGQRQLISIARAFLIDPPLLILDEATSSVDTRTEMIIQNAMTRLMAGRTTFVIAHRLSTIRDADNIIVMNNGSIVETGNHAELLAKNGFYADLHKSQFSESA